MKTWFFLIVALLALTGIFEFYPVIEKARAYIHVSNYENPNVACAVLLSDRPWYGRLNHWFFFWITIVPALVFLARPLSPVWLRSGRIIMAFLICYAAMNLAVHLQWEIRNAPFREDSFHPDPLNGWRMDCANYAGDGFSYVLALYLSWIPAGVYTGICLLLWRLCHRAFSREKFAEYKSDIAECILLWGLKIYAVLVLLFVLAVTVNAIYYFGFGDTLYDPKLLFVPYYFLIRPLLIPFDIFL